MEARWTGLLHECFHEWVFEGGSTACSVNWHGIMMCRVVASHIELHSLPSSRWIAIRMVAYWDCALEAGFIRPTVSGATW